MGILRTVSIQAWEDYSTEEREHMDVKQLILSIEYLRMPLTSCILLLRVNPSVAAKGEALRKGQHWADISFSG